MGLQLRNMQFMHNSKKKKNPLTRTLTNLSSKLVIKKKPQTFTWLNGNIIDVYPLRLVIAAAEDA